MPMKNCCMLTNSSGQRVWTRVIKGRQGRDEPHSSSGKVAFTPSDIDHQFPAFFKDKAPA